MHDIEPYYNWRHLYIASEDDLSPFYGRDYSEFFFSSSIYNYFIHPQWDNFGSSTLYLKILYVSYSHHFCIIELLGEWNDCIYNDIMYLKRNVIEFLEEQGINKYILIGENVLNFHSDDDSYYQEWFDELEDGWIACINFRDHVVKEFEQASIDYYMAMGGKFNDLYWRTTDPVKCYQVVESMMMKRLNA
jgi:hypothetical protein